MRYVSLGLGLLAVCGVVACLVGAGYYNHRWMNGGLGARKDDHETEFMCSCLAMVVAPVTVVLLILAAFCWGGEV